MFNKILEDNKTVENNLKRYLITGANFENKGAEAMLFTVISNLRKKEPKCKIFVMLSCGCNEESFKKIYDLEFFNESIKEMKKILNPFKYFLIKLSNKTEKNKTLQAYTLADEVLDISGYCLTSDFGGGGID